MKSWCDCSPFYTYSLNGLVSRSSQLGANFLKDECYICDTRDALQQMASFVAASRELFEQNKDILVQNQRLIVENGLLKKQVEDAACVVLSAGAEVAKLNQQLVEFRSDAIKYVSLIFVMLVVAFSSALLLNVLLPVPTIRPTFAILLLIFFVGYAGMGFFALRSKKACEEMPSGV